MENSATIAENKSLQETNAETNLTANDLDPLVHFSRFLGIPETILNHLSGKDLLLISEVSPSWYNCIASSRDLMEKIKVVFNGRRELQTEDYDLMKNSSRKYQNIEVARWCRNEGQDRAMGISETFLRDYYCVSSPELDFFLSKDWKNISISNIYFRSKIDLWKFLSSIESSIESFSVNNGPDKEFDSFDDELSSNFESFKVLNFLKLKHLKMKFTESGLMGETYVKFLKKSVAIEKFDFYNYWGIDIDSALTELLENFVKIINLRLSTHQSKMFEDESWKRFKFNLKSLTISVSRADEISINFRRFLESQSDHLEELSINAGHDNETFTLIMKMQKLERLIITNYVDFSTDEIPNVISTSITHLKLECLLKPDIFKFLLMSMPNIRSLCFYLSLEITFKNIFNGVDPNISIRRENKVLFNMIMRMQKLEFLELKNFKVYSKDEAPTEISLSITHLKLTFVVNAVSLKYLLNSMPNVKSLHIYVIDKEIFQVLLEIDREFEELKVVCLIDVDEEDLKIFLIDENDKCVVKSFD